MNRQKWYDENRERFDAETESIDISPPKTSCNHYLKRKTAIGVECSKCRIGFIDLGKWKLEKGKVLEES